MLHCIPEEVPAAAADLIDHDDPIVDIINPSPPRAYSIPSVDTDTIPSATSKVVARALVLSYPNDSTGFPRPVLDVRKKRKNLEPIPCDAKDWRRPQASKVC